MAQDSNSNQDKEDKQQGKIFTPGFLQAIFLASAAVVGLVNGINRPTPLGQIHTQELDVVEDIINEISTKGLQAENLRGSFSVHEQAEGGELMESFRQSRQKEYYSANIGQFKYTPAAQELVVTFGVVDASVVQNAGPNVYFEGLQGREYTVNTATGAYERHDTLSAHRDTGAAGYGQTRTSYNSVFKK